MKTVQEIFQKISIINFIEYYYTFEKYKDSRSNKEIINEFKINGETWTDNACASRANVGKTIFKEGLEIECLKYIVNSANENKITSDIKTKAREIYSSKTNFFIDPNVFSNETDEYIFEKLYLDADVKSVEKQKTFTQEEKTTLVKFRIGQSFFRDELFDLWGRCAVTGCTNKNVLIASHIKPFCECNWQERYDKYNGFLLSPCYDKLFDLYLISFDDKGDILISKSLSEGDLKALKVSRTDKLVYILPENQKYLNYHRSEFYKRN